LALSCDFHRGDCMYARQKTWVSVQTLIIHPKYQTFKWQSLLDSDLKIRKIFSKIKGGRFYRVRKRRNYNGDRNLFPFRGHHT
jgi:hypothetical protein